MARTIDQHVLENSHVRVVVISLGCITQSWEVDGPYGVVPVVLGYDEPHHYADNPTFMGAVVGRVAGRISRASFGLDGKQWKLSANEGSNQLHGGPDGLHKRHWSMDADGSAAVRLRLRSPHGDQGYPGHLELTVIISLEGHKVTYDMHATSDRPTPVSLTQHSYYNLMGGGTVWDHFLKIPAGATLETDSAMLPTGVTLPLDDIAADFRPGRRISDADTERQGLDLTYAGLCGPVEVTAPNGMTLT